MGYQNEANRIPSSISTGRSKHGQTLFRFSAGFPRIPPGQKIFKQISKQLKRDVLESKRRAVEEFQDEKLFIKFLKRCYVRVTERAVRSLSQLPQIVPRDFVFRDVKGKDLDG